VSRSVTLREPNAPVGDVSNVGNNVLLVEVRNIYVLAYFENSWKSTLKNTLS
jgi:hypothetical protein